MTISPMTTTRMGLINGIIILISVILPIIFLVSRGKKEERSSLAEKTGISSHPEECDPGGSEE
jgi:hypothetical protein